MWNRFLIAALAAALLVGCNNQGRKATHSLGGTTPTGQANQPINGTNQPPPTNPANAGPAAQTGPTSPNPDGGHAGAPNHGGATGITPKPGNGH